MPDQGKFYPLGKQKWGTWGGHDLHLYEPSPLIDYGVVPVGCAVGQAFLMPNCENRTIPHYMGKYQKSAFPHGKAGSAARPGNGSKLWVLSKYVMESGRSRFSRYFCL